ncbi:MAG: ATP-binding protein [Acidobacteriota bacterium]
MDLSTSRVNTPVRNEVQKEHILIVDDSPVVRKAFARSLGAKYDCSEAGSVVEAFELLKTNEFELVITDIIMPGLSGIELLRRVIESYPKTAVLIVSGVDRPQRALDAVRLGAFDYLIKPCDAGVLELTVERALERRNLLINANRYKRDLEERNKELVHGKAQLERLQAQIVQSEKMASIGQLSAGIAHELNNPVGFVHGNLDLLEGCVNDLMGLLRYYDQAGLPPNIKAEADAIKTRIHFADTVNDLGSIISDCREGTTRIKDIVQNLRTFSRLDEAEFKKTNIHEGIDSTIRLLSRYLSSGNIDLVRDYGNIPAIDAYSAQLNQVWMNLLVNAAQAVGAVQGVVRIATHSDGTNVTVSVSDTGKGIEPDVLSKIFDPFFTTKPVGEGTGLGLSITFGIVERHGGKIEVRSELNKGTTFSVILPLRIEAHVSASAVHVPSAGNQSYAI